MLTYQNFLAQHEAQLVGAGIPLHLWSSLFHKLSNDIFDAEIYFNLALDEDNDIHAIVNDDIETIDSKNDANMVFLVDHAWTFTAENARDQLTAHPTLLSRMQKLMRLSHTETNEDNIENVLSKMWNYVQMYRISNLRPEDSASIWYVMDEFGSAIEHSDEPNFRMAPFFFNTNNCAYSIIWPIEDLERGDFLTLDYISKQADKDTKVALLSALFYPNETYIEELEVIVQKRKADRTIANAVNTLKTSSARDSEVAAENISVQLQAEDAMQLPVKIWTDLALMHQHLTDPNFTFVDNKQEANVVWPTRHIKDYVSLYENPNIRVFNQFPNEKILTCKDLLYETCKKANNNVCPPWLALTFNMESEFPELMQEITRRERHNETANEDEVLDNHWICKPWNLARSLDTTIAKNSAHLSKLAQTGPKVACKYIHKPLLIKQRKFDFRFLVMVSSIAPLKVFVSGVYWLRIANKPFSMDNFDDFQKHFTVMNYSEFGVEEMNNSEFESHFEQEYPSENWFKVKEDIFQSIKALFVLATTKPTPEGLGNSAKSRALYGVDVMLEWDENDAIKPVILEVNFHPDCKRACKYFPGFYNDLMNVLVLNKTENTVHGLTAL